MQFAKVTRTFATQGASGTQAVPHGMNVEAGDEGVFVVLGHGTTANVSSDIVSFDNTNFVVTIDDTNTARVDALVGIGGAVQPTQF